MTGVVAPYRVSAIENTGVAASRGIAVDTAGTANAKGSWVQLLAATTYDAEGVIVELGMFNADRHGLLDLAVGAAAAEQVIIPNILCNPIKLDRYYFPVRVPAGTRIAARAQTSFNGADSIVAKVMLCATTRFGPATGGQVADLGTSTASSSGTQLDPGAVANTKGAYAQLIAASAQDIKGLVLLAQRDAVSPGDGVPDWLVDLAVGAAAAEQVAIPDVWFVGEGFRGLMGCAALYVPVGIPAGSRLAARCQCSSIVAGDRLLRVAAYGVY